MQTEIEEMLPPKLTKNRNFQENRQPSGRVCGSVCQSDTCVLFLTKKPSGNCLDGLMFYLHLSAFGISFTKYLFHECFWSLFYSIVAAERILFDMIESDRRYIPLLFMLQKPFDG